MHTDTLSGGSLKISRRLNTAASMVTPGNTVADVGCDHGYLPIMLVRDGIAPAAIAMDVRPGPLSRAKAHIEEYGLTTKIETRLSDGLSGLAAGECDTLVIAGMGGPLIEKILGNAPEKAQSFKEMILGPQSDVPHFRRWLYENGFCIIDEAMVCEEGKYYPLIKAVYGETEEKNAGEDIQLKRGEGECISSEAINPEYSLTDELSMYCGPILLGRRNTVLKEFLLWRQGICDQIIMNLKNADSESAAAREKEIDEEKQLIERALSCYE